MDGPDLSRLASSPLNLPRLINFKDVPTSPRRKKQIRDNNGELDDHSRICCFPLPVYLLIIALRYMIRREYCMLTIHY